MLMRVVGIDPGSHHLGWGMVEAVGTRLVHIACGTLHARQGGLVQRLRYLADALDDLLLEYKPQVASVECIFYAKNAQSALILGHLRGAVLLSLARLNLTVFEYTASQIKQALTGRGRADKAQVQCMVQLLLGIKEPLEMDTSDAIAAAICHIQHSNSTINAYLARS